MGLLQIILLAIIQGLAELLPVSSSAHVIVAARLMDIDAATPEMTLLLVMLHTGTMLAVIIYFWKAWRARFFASRAVFKRQFCVLALATALTGGVGYPLIKVIEKTMAPAALEEPPRWREPTAAEIKERAAMCAGEIEKLFGRLDLIAPALAAAGVLILAAGLRRRGVEGTRQVGLREAAWMGAVQGLCLPFRGFSRSGATISTGMLAGGIKARVEEFSFALAVIVTPPAIGRELLRLIKAEHLAGHRVAMSMFGPSFLGLVVSFLAGLMALKWLSSWLEKGRWYWFGIYCLAAAAGVQAIYLTMGNK